MHPSPTTDPILRCLNCVYALTGLAEPCCPECGREFSWEDETTFDNRPPFVWWRFWLPPCVLTACALLLLLILPGIFSLPMLPPILLGSLLGYRLRMRWACLLTAGLYCPPFFIGSIARLVDALGWSELLTPWATLLISLAFSLPFSLIAGLMLGMTARFLLTFPACGFSQRDYLQPLW